MHSGSLHGRSAGDAPDRDDGRGETVLEGPATGVVLAAAAGVLVLAAGADA